MTHRPIETHKLDELGSTVTRGAIEAGIPAVVRAQGKQGHQSSLPRVLHFSSLGFPLVVLGLRVLVFGALGFVLLGFQGFGNYGS